jgi:2Fe-2S ferredoxin
MGQIIFVEHNNNQHVVAIEQGKSLMQHAVDNGVPGIDADCGGGCACGTCHVIVADAWATQLDALSNEEQQMLNMTPEQQQTSRLSCQVTVTDALDGLTVRLPEFQM